MPAYMHPCTQQPAVVPLMANCCAPDGLQVMAQERKIDLSAHPFRVYLTPPGSCDFTGKGLAACSHA